MYPDSYNDSPYGYYCSNTSFGGWPFIIALIIIAAFLIKLDSSLIDKGITNSDNSQSADGVAEYWYSDMPEQTMGSSEVAINRTSVHKTHVTDKNHSGLFDRF